ncbi:Headcase protein-like protein [Heterocephalus glaber]|uniref:Headcase protein-like protein n=1 Tax=Heterocephalus glaber TaxID=10181 RepID=G5BT13_HETGA|nr:Headcase protein-like protein [Heterocephalus glaber]
MWPKKGYDLAFRFCSCCCWGGHSRKDTDWYQVKQMQDEKPTLTASTVMEGQIGFQYYSEDSSVQQCPHCGNLDYHFMKPFSSFKVLEAYW